MLAFPSFFEYFGAMFAMFCNDNYTVLVAALQYVLCFIICVLSFRRLNDFTLVNVVLCLFEYLTLVRLSIYFPKI
jgi:hypothetical protein